MVRMGHGQRRARRRDGRPAARHAHRTHRVARAVRESLLRRTDAQSPLHGFVPVGVCALRQHAGCRRGLTSAPGRAAAAREASNKAEPRNFTANVVLQIISETLMAGKFRFTVAGLLFAAGMINYMDRAALGIVAPIVSKQLSLSPSH